MDSARVGVVGVNCKQSCCLQPHTFRISVWSSKAAFRGFEYSLVNAATGLKVRRRLLKASISFPKGGTGFHLRGPEPRSEPTSLEVFANSYTTPNQRQLQHKTDACVHEIPNQTTCGQCSTSKAGTRVVEPRRRISVGFGGVFFAPFRL